MSASNGAVLVFFALALIYAVLFIFCLVRIRKLHNFSPEWRHSQTFYCILLLQSALRTVLFLILCFDASHWRNLTIFCLLSTPDSLFIVTYLLMFWQLLSVFYYAHSDSREGNSFLKAISRKPTKSVPSLLFVMGIGAWILVQASLYLTMEMSQGERVSTKTVWMEVGTVNICVATSVLATMLILQLSYSGHPLRTYSWGRKLRKMNVSTALWSFGRLLDGILSITDSRITEDIETMVSGSDTSGDVLFSTGLLIAYLILCEVICIFFVLDYSYMAIFVLSESEERDGQAHPPLLLTVGTEVYEDAGAMQFPPFPDFPNIDDKELKLLDGLQMRKGALGQIFRGEYRGREIACRKIVLPRISHYVEEEFAEELGQLGALDVQYLLPCLGARVAGSTVLLIYPWFERGSLHAALHVLHTRLTLYEKLRIAYRICVCLDLLHSKGLAHGHLSSHNVLLDAHFRPYLSDFGLLKLRKYCGLILSYSCKAAWTSPSLLAEKSSTPMKPQASDDVYSFGIIIWEMVTGQLPFPNEGRNRLYDLIVKDQLRPEIPITISTGLRDLMISCWNSDPSKRADISILKDTLSREMDLTRAQDSS